jgi:hypothetical protein
MYVCVFAYIYVYICAYVNWKPVRARCMICYSLWRSVLTELQLRSVVHKKQQDTENSLYNINQ